MIKIVHAYPNLMNILGGAADVLAIERLLKDAGEEVEVYSFETGENPGLEDADLFYCGAGTEDRMKIACKDAKRYADEFAAYAQRGGHALLMGTGMALAGKEGIGYADVSLKPQDFRHYSDIIEISEITGDRIVGAFNSSCTKTINEKPFARVEFDSNSHLGGSDGFVKNNIVGSENTAPLLARNPIFLKHFAERVLGRELPENKETWYREAVIGYENAFKMLEQ